MPSLQVSCKLREGRDDVLSVRVFVFLSPVTGIVQYVRKTSTCRPKIKMSRKNVLRLMWVGTMLNKKMYICVDFLGVRVEPRRLMKLSFHDWQSFRDDSLCSRLCRED